VQSSELLVWAGIVAGLASYAVLVSARLQKLLGPIGRWISQRQVRRIERAGAVNDARVEDLSEQVQYLLDEQRRSRGEQQAMWKILRTHQRWDVDVARQVRELGGDVADPPPLFPAPEVT
jgi:hypothetical protein